MLMDSQMPTTPTAIPLLALAPLSLPSSTRLNLFLLPLLPPAGSFVLPVLYILAAATLSERIAIHDHRTPVADQEA